MKLLALIPLFVALTVGATQPPKTMITRIGSYESLYILTKEDGRWGVKLRSSFAQ